MRYIKSSLILSHCSSCWDSPWHGSLFCFNKNCRPDLVEGLLLRTARRTPRGIRVSSRDELREGILRHLGEADAEPVAHGRRRDLLDIDPTAEGSCRGHPPPGWGRQGTLVAGRYTTSMCRC